MRNGVYQRGPKVLFVLLLSLNCNGQTYTITTVAGNVPGLTSTPALLGDGGKATAASLSAPDGLAVDSVGNLYIADKGNYRVRRVSPQGIITTLAGTGNPAPPCSEGGRCDGDGGPATSASLNQPRGVATDRAGNVYIADFGNSVIRKVAPDGVISTFAGSGRRGYSGDGGPAVNAELTPYYLAMDSDDNLYVSEESVIRKISPAGGISTFAGNGVKGYAGDGGPAIKASLSFPGGIAIDGKGSVFIADSGNCVVRKVGPDGVITTVAGDTGYGFAGDGGPAIRASFQNPSSVAVDSLGNLFLSDVNNNRVREVLASGIILTAAGTGNYVFEGDGGLASKAGLQSPSYVLAVGTNVYVSDFGHNLIRLLKPGAPVSGPIPAISQGGIVPIFSSAQTIQRSSWISIYGNNLISGTEPVAWNGDYPLALGGTTVTINKVPVALSYVSPTLINAYVPSSAGNVNGAVTVTVTDANGTGTGTTVFAQASPALCVLGDGKHVAGIILRSNGLGAYGGGTYDIIGPAGSSLGYPTVPVKAGDSIVLFGTGFGGTDRPESIPLSGISRAISRVGIVIGSTSLEPTFAGLSSPGIFQFNLTLPQGLQSGDQPLAATVIGLSSQKNVFITVQ